MPILSRSLLADLGINLSDEDFQSLAEELSHMQEASDDQIVDWVRANVPDFADIVSDEIDILLGELAEDSEKMAA